MHLAAQSGQAKAVEALLAAGADPSIADAIHGGRPSGWADFGGHPAISKMLYAAEGAARSENRGYGMSVRPSTLGTEPSTWGQTRAARVDPGCRVRPRCVAVATASGRITLLA